MRGLALVVILVPAFSGIAVLAQEPGEPLVHLAHLAAVLTPYDLTADLRTLPAARPWKPGDPVIEIPRRQFPRDEAHRPDEPIDPPTWVVDPLLARQKRHDGAATRAFTTGLNFAGQGFSGVQPPDPVGDVGGVHYIQMINGASGTIFAVYDKSTGSLVAGPTALESLWSGPGTNPMDPCANGMGDPIVLYDHLADRWLLSEFSAVGNHLCIYISKTNDPIAGGWWGYDLGPTASFPDYPKYAVWPDAYYLSTNESSPRVYALERAQMLAGGSAAALVASAPRLAGFNFQALTPADLDGATPPPAGAPGYFARHRDDEAHNPLANDPTRDFVEVWEFAVDWSGTPTGSLTGPTNLQVTEFDSALCGLLSFTCFPQPGSATRLDPLREVVMWRLQYRNFGTHQSLVGNFVTDVDGTDRGGIRWFELRRSVGGWSLFQEGTYSPDAVNRWMGSAAMDGAGNLAIGYNVTSSTTAPGLRYAGRLASDPPGVLTQGESTLVAASAANLSNRYGDYSALGVDPVDDCTFWFTGEYNATSNWSTRIGSFRLCSSTPQVTITSPPAGSYDQSAPIYFAGTATDVPDGDLTAALAWSSDLDGALAGSGSGFFETLVSTGAHAITASATDGDGNSGIASVAITIDTSGCSDHAWLSGVLPGSQIRRARSTITSLPPTTVPTGAHLTVRAGQSAVFGEQLEVAGSLTVELAGSACP